LPNILQENSVETHLKCVLGFFDERLHYKFSAEPKVNGFQNWSAPGEVWGMYKIALFSESLCISDLDSIAKEQHEKNGDPRKANKKQQQQQQRPTHRQESDKQQMM